MEEKCADMEATTKDDATTDSTIDAPTKPPSAVALLWPALLCLFIDYLGVAIAIPVLPYFVLEIPWDTSTVCPQCPQDAFTTNFTATSRCGEVTGCGRPMDVGFALTAFYAGQIIGNLVMSALSDRVGRKPIIMASLLGSSLGYTWCGLAPTLTHLYLGRVFSGIAGGTMPVVQAMVLDTIGDPRERPKYFGIAGAMLGVAFAVGPALGAVVTALIGKRAALFAPAILASIACAVGSMNIRETRVGGGICGARDAKVDRLYAQGAATFGSAMQAAQGGGAPSSGGGASGAGNLPAPTALPRAVFACAASMTLAAFSFTGMTSVTALTWPPAFNFGAEELGVFLAIGGLISAVVNIVFVKRTVARFGAEKTVLVCAVVLGVGVALYTFIDLLAPGSSACASKKLSRLAAALLPLLCSHELHRVGVSTAGVLFLYFPYFVLVIWVPWTFHMPCLVSIAGERAPATMRGKATGLVAAGMSLGFALCPLAAGPVFESNVLRIEHAYGSFSHLMFVICGLVNFPVEFGVLLRFVGLGAPRPKSSGATTSTASEAESVAVVVTHEPE